MTVLTSDQQTTIRQRPHRARLYLAIYRPRSAYSATINQPGIARGAITITYSNPAGVLADVLPGMTMKVGTTPGADDLGRVRVRSITGNSVTVAENSIVYQNGAFLNFIRFFEPWAIYPRITVDSNNIPSFFKDYDITYTDQNSNLDPVPMMGPNLAAMLDAVTGLASLYFDGSASYNLSSTITSYLWTFEGALTPTSTSATPGFIKWNTSGNYIVSLKVTSANGKSYTGYRHIVIKTQPGGSDPPIVSWGTDSALAGDYSRGDWEGRIWLRQGSLPLTVNKADLVIIFADTWYGSTKVNFGGHYPNRENLIFTGYVRSGSDTIDPETNKASFAVSNIAGRLAAEEVYAISVSSSANPGVSDTTTPPWSQVKDMTVDIALYHYIRWHSTIYSICDVNPNGHNINVQFADFQRSPLYQSIDQFINTTLMGHCEVDRQGQMWLEKKVDIVPVAQRTLGTSMQLTRADWKDQLVINQVREGPTSYTEVSGIQYSGPENGAFQAFISVAPGLAPAYEGTVQTIVGMVLEDQATTNQLAGDAWTDANKQFKEVTLAMSGNYPIFDIAPQERLQITLAAAENFLGLVWTNKNFIPRRISFDYNVDEQVLMTSLTVEEETNGTAGVPGPYPGTPPVNPGPTPTPVPPPQQFPGPGPSAVSIMVMLNRNGTSPQVVITQNWTALSPTWADRTLNLTGKPLCVSTDKAHGKRVFVLTDTGVWRNSDITNASGSWTQLVNSAWVQGQLGITGCITFTALVCDPNSIGHVIFATFNTGNIACGSTTSTTVAADLWISVDGGNTFAHGAVVLSLPPGLFQPGVLVGALTFKGFVGQGSLDYYYWDSALNYSEALADFSANGALIGASESIGVDAGAILGSYHSRAGGGDNRIVWPVVISSVQKLGVQVGAISGGVLPTAAAPTTPVVLGTFGQTRNGIAVSYDGTLAALVGQNKHLYLYNFGTQVWTDKGLVTGVTTPYSVLHIPPNDNSWIVAGTSVVITTDQMATWVSQLGNLLSIIPSPSINGIDYFYTTS